MLSDFLVHRWLGNRRFIAFIVATTSIANDVYDDILLKLHSIINGQLGNKNDGFRVITIDMENGRLNHLGDLSTISGRTGILPLTDGVTNLIINNDVYRSTRVVTAGL